MIPWQVRRWLDRRTAFGWSPLYFDPTSRALRCLPLGGYAELLRDRLSAKREPWPVKPRKVLVISIEPGEQ